jgi:hypothetical protein
MGICFNDALLMWNARCDGASFENVLTVGRQSLTLHPAEVAFFRSACAKQGFGDALLENYKFYAYADEFFRGCLGAKSINAMDYSAYEGADIIHDLNTPVAADLSNRFDAVIDGGSLEHVFNFPVAIASLMTMVRVGGRLFMTTPANNMCGHGMYQFSPELMFRIFSPENGFEVVRLQLVEARFPSVELTRNRRVYEVRDPAEVRSRVRFVSKRPVMMMVEAKKLVAMPLFVRPPLQSDYVSHWTGQDIPATSLTPRLREVVKRIFHLLPRALRMWLQMRLTGYRELRSCSLTNHNFFRRL